MWLTPWIGARVAKYEKSFEGDLDQFLPAVDASIVDQSATASIVDSSDVMVGATRVAVRVYERYSSFGGNRVSLNLTAAACQGWVFVSAITSGGSQAMFLKINTAGEESFLDAAIVAIQTAMGER
jgi:hypothetical protein